MKRFVAILAMALFASSNATASGGTAFARLQVLAGPNAVVCGTVKQRLSESQAFECARKALATQKPFWVAERFQGLDSVTWRGVALGPDGKIWLLGYAVGIGEDDDLVETLCREVQFLPGQIKCSP